MSARAKPRQWVVLPLCLAAAAIVSCSRTQPTATASWNPAAAAAYLDQREVTWMGWPGASRDQGTFCVSCHTVLPYALSRPALHKALGEQGLSNDECKILDNITKRVRLWNKMGPYYGADGYDNGKPAESRGTEAVLNALILASNDAQEGKLGDATRLAFDHMWVLQQTAGEGRGAWSWLQFGLEPWEAKDSQYYGAALAAIAVGTAPENYRSTPDIQAKLRILRDYLNGEYATQSTINHVVLLLASTKLPGLLDPERQRAIIGEVMEEQRADGGWRLSPLVWPKGWSLPSFARVHFRPDWTRQESQSDGYATGLITLALHQAGVPAEDPRLKAGLSWLERNQSKEDGSWPSSSLTQRRNASSNVGHFMKDAATAYAVLSLSENQVAGSNMSQGQNEFYKDRLTTSSNGITAANR